MSTTCRKFIHPLAWGVLILKCAAPAWAAQYTVTTLPGLGGPQTLAFGINTTGQVAGAAKLTATPASDWRAYLYQLDPNNIGQTINIGPADSPYNWAYDINNPGRVVGKALFASDSVNPHAFLYQNETMEDLGLLGYGSEANAINDAGQVVGGADTGSGWHAVRYENGQIFDLEAGGSNGGTAYGINNLGQIVGGTRFSASSPVHAFLNQNGAMQDLGTLGGTDSSADDINESGQVVGWSYVSGFTSRKHAFLYQNGQMTDLGTLGGTTSEAFAINADSLVVGASSNGNNDYHAFIYGNGVMRDLNDLIPADSGWVLTEAHAINDAGQIAGFGTYNGVTASFLISPVKPTANAGADLAVNEGELANLNGSASSAPGCTSSSPQPCPAYAWNQVAGTTVSLDNATSGSPSFTAPTLPQGTKSEVLTFELTVSDDLFASTPDTVDVTVKHVNVAPVADAGAPQTVNEGGTVTLNGIGSYDPDAGATELLSYGWVNPAEPQTPCAEIVLTAPTTAQPTFVAPLVGSAGLSCSFDLNVTDADGASADASTTVTIQNVNQSPVADAGADQTVNEGDTPVTLNGNGSIDPDGDSLTYAWTQLSGTPVSLSEADTAAPTFTAPQVGAANDTLEFELTVSDGLLSSVAQTSVLVRDQDAPPTCSRGKADPRLLWPPNHKMEKVEIENVGEDKRRRAIGIHWRDDDRDDVEVTVLSVTQDEPTEGLNGHDSSPDAAILRDGHKLLLRAERSGNGNGRVYQIRYRAEDKHAQICEGMVSVCVPKFSGKHSACTDDGQNYDSLAR